MTTGLGNETKDLREAQEPSRRSEWRPRNNREVDRRGGKPSGKEWVPVEKGDAGVHIKPPLPQTDSSRKGLTVA